MPFSNPQTLDFQKYHFPKISISVRKSEKSLLYIIFKFPLKNSKLIQKQPSAQNPKTLPIRNFPTPAGSNWLNERQDGLTEHRLNYGTTYELVIDPGVFEGESSKNSINLKISKILCEQKKIEKLKRSFWIIKSKNLK